MPAVRGLILLDRVGGQSRIMILKKYEYLNALKTGRAASIAVIMGASWFGASIASSDFPKQMSEHSG